MPKEKRHEDCETSQNDDVTLSEKDVEELIEKCRKGKNYCIVCNVQYSDKIEFESHAKTHNKKIACEICKKICPNQLRLLSHVRNVHSNENGKEKIPCDVCRKLFASRNSLWVHKKNRHVENWDLICSICGFGTNSKEKYDEHVQKGGNENHSSFECDFCDKKLATQNNLDKHVRLYHTIHRCDTCRKEYGSRYNLLRHVQRSHGNGRKIRDVPCEKCGKKFFTKWELKVHAMNIHGKEKLGCSYCDYVTAYPQILREHVTKHTKEYPYVCEWCGKGFVNKTRLKNHSGKEHLNSVVVTCTVCGKKFHSRKNLLFHMERHEPGYELKNHGCDICGKKFHRKSGLRKHVRRHHEGHVKTYECLTCGKVLTSSRSLKYHENIHTGERPFSCDICHRGFARKNYLVSHVRTHTREKPYSCQQCDSSFSQRGTLTIHLRKHKKTERLD